MANEKRVRIDIKHSIDERGAEELLRMVEQYCYVAGKRVEVTADEWGFMVLKYVDDNTWRGNG